MVKKVIPQRAGSVLSEIKKTPKAVSFDYSQMHPCWRIGHFDYCSKWGLNNLGRFKFVYTEELLEIVTNFGDEDLNSALESLDGRLCSIKEFWQDFENIYTKHIPITLVNCIERNFVCNAFIEKVYPKLKIYEENTWDEIRMYSHRRGQDSVSNNHYVSIQKLNKEAQDRLVELGYSDRSEIYSLRLEGKIRIYGFREMNFLDIIWVDLEHEIYK